MKIEKGVEWVSQMQSWKDKMNDCKDDLIKQMKETCLEKYGCEQSIQNEDIKNKRKETNIEKFGDDYGKYFSNKSKETLINRDGNLQGLNHHELNSYSKIKYLWKDVRFDSKWEIYFYQYLVDNNIPF